MISTWCSSSLLSDLIKRCVSWEHSNSTHLRVKVATGLSAVDLIMKTKIGDLGSLSLTLSQKISALSQELFKLPAFSELLNQYAQHGYSGRQDLENLILSDLFYHIQGELEGRQIDNRLFKELLQFLLDSRFLDTYRYKQENNLLESNNGVYLYNTVHLRADLGLEMWDLLGWKESKKAAETMLLSLEDANSVILLSNSKLAALRGLITLLYMHDDNLTEKQDSTGLKNSEQVVSSCIDHLCQCLHTTLESLTPTPGTSETSLDILTAQAELLLLLVRCRSSKCPAPASALILKTSGYGLKNLCSHSPSLGIEAAKELLLTLVLTSIESGTGSLEVSSEASNASLGLLPILCNCVQHPDHCALSLSAIDMILKGFTTPATWFPIIQNHFPLQHIVQKLPVAPLSKTVLVILKFLLNLACLRQGAEMLLNAGILVSLKMLLSNFCEGGPFSMTQNECVFSNISNKAEKSQQPIWGLGLALLTAVIQSLGDSSSSASVGDCVMSCILVEKAPVVSYYLSAPDFPTDGHEKKRARALKSSISLSELNETQNTLALICVLATHWYLWKKILQDMQSQLREKSIHLLAFISRATQRPGESPRRVAPLLCHPVLKEEFEWYKAPSFINSKIGWFSLSTLGCKLNPKFASLQSRTTALILRDPSNDNGDSFPQTHLSDLIAIEIYKIAFLLLKFFCIQAESSARKAEEVGFVNLEHFPELPMPDIYMVCRIKGFPSSLNCVKPTR